MEKVNSFKQGFVDELTGKACRDGVSAFNLENAAGTAVHAAVGVGIGLLLSKFLPMKTGTNVVTKFEF